MNYDEASAKAASENTLAYILAGIVLVPIIFLDSKWESKGYWKFLIKSSYLLLPGSVLATFSVGGTELFSEKLLAWLLAIVLIYIFISPAYFLYWIFKRLVTYRK